MKKEVVIDKKKSGSMDFGFFVATIALLCIGLVMVASASSYHALINYKDSNYLLYRQLFFAVCGFIGMIVISNIDYRKYKKWSYLGFIISAILLLLVITPLGVSRNGAQRWLGIGETLQFQPSEIMKPVLVLAIATYLSRNYKNLNNLRGYIVPAIMMLIVILLMYLQKHMSGMLILIIAGVSVIFVSGIKINPKLIIVGVLLLAAVVGAFVIAEDFRMGRILAHFDKSSDILGENWQSSQSLYAIGSGGLFGRGLGQSREKYLWLPEAQNDFVFAILGEELGFIGTSFVCLLFAFFIYKGFKTAFTCKDMYGSLICSGIMSVFAVQIMINIGVVTGVLPVTGMPLPFFSYGGTSLFINLCSMGILLNISKNCERN